jgi:hypothetical protein
VHQYVFQLRLPSLDSFLPVLPKQSMSVVLPGLLAELPDSREKRS